ncbi:MAG: hypothetical protein V4601_06725 [Pseudomonadota bacterium]
MRLVALTAAACSLFASVAMAQETPAAAAAAPAAAESSLPGTTVFSESEARHHVERRGYTRLRRMEKGADGLWTGTANKGGTLGTFAIEKMGKVNFTPSP